MRKLLACLAIALALTGCTSEEGGSGESGGGSASSGLEFDAETVTFSWDETEGATQYYVLVAAEGAPPWVWLGAETSAVYGEIGGEDPDLLVPDDAAARIELQEGKTYSWFVTSLDSDGEILEVSENQTFTP